MKKSEESLCELCDTLKCLKISIMGVLEGEEREKGAKRLFKEIIAENFSSLGSDNDMQV